MAKLGTKQRPAIVRVQTEARAQEVAALFAEHGWQFILGIEPGKPENIADLTRLLQTTRSGHQIAYDKAKKSAPRRTSNASHCEYFPDNDALKLHMVVSFSLSVLFLILFLMSTSLWYVVFLVLPLLYSLSLSCAIFLNQRIVLYDNKITILRRMHAPLTATVADALYQIIVKKSAMIRFRFRFYSGRRVAQICPSAYKNGDQLIKQLTAIIKQEKIVVDIIEK